MPKRRTARLLALNLAVSGMQPFGIATGRRPPRRPVHEISEVL
ncbi:hypothetical protein [Rhodopila sp.]